MAIIVNLDVVLAQKMSVTELSEKVGITMANISILKWKSKSHPFSTLEKICQVLECQPGDLLTYKNDSNTIPEE